MLVLDYSIQQWHNTPALLVLISKRVSSSILSVIKSRNITYKLIDEIENLHNINDDVRNYRYVFTKLRMFELYEFDKIVYLDADMLVCNNLDSLFERASFSAVVAGGLSKEYSAWSDFNTGLLIIEPSPQLTFEIFAAVKQLPSCDSGDQGFLNAFFSDWTGNTHLHLHHKYNVPLLYLDEYCQIYPKEINFTYKRRKLTTDICVLHFWGRYKPWDINLFSLERSTTQKWEQALLLWHDLYDKS